jgi:hypothetical protein
MPQPPSVHQPQRVMETQSANQGTTPYGFPARPESSEASTPWMLPPLSDILLPRKTLDSEKQPIRASAFRLDTYNGAYDSTGKPQLVRAPVSATSQTINSPTSPRFTSGHTSVGSPHQRIITPPNASSESHVSPRRVEFASRSSNVFNGIQDGSPAHGKSSLPPPLPETKGMNNDLIQRSVEYLNTTVPSSPSFFEDGPGTVAHYSGFTPVNSGRDRPFHVNSSSTPRKRSRQETGLNLDQRQLASQMRNVAACTNCKQLKRKVRGCSPLNQTIA